MSARIEERRKQIAEKVKRNKSGKFSYFQKYLLNIHELKFFADLLNTSESIHTLHLQNLLIKSDNINIVSDFIKSNKTIHTLDLSGNEIDNESLKKLCTALKENHSLESLNISNNNIESITSLGDVFRENRSIHTLLLENNKLKLKLEDVTDFVKASNMNQTIQILDLAKNNIGSHGLEFLNIPSLVSLNLSYNRVHDIQPYSIVIEQHKSLRILNLEGNKINSPFCLISSHSLESLYLGGNSIGEKSDDEFIRWSKLKNQSLQTLDLARNNIGSKLSTLCDGLKTMALQSLHLENNGIINIQALCQWLSESTTLHTLNLRWNKLENLSYLGEALKKNKTLRSLNLESCQISKDGIATLSEGLSFNTIIECLNLEGNFMTFDASRNALLHLKNALKSHPSLQILNLNQNQIDDEGMKAFSEYLKTNQVLHTLHLGTNQLTSKGVEYLFDALKSNKVLHTLDLGNNMIDDKGLSVIQDSLKEISSLHSINLSFNVYNSQEIVHILKRQLKERTLNAKCKVHSTQSTQHVENLNSSITTQNVKGIESRLSTIFSANSDKSQVDEGPIHEQTSKLVQCSLQSEIGNNIDLTTLMKNIEIINSENGIMPWLHDFQDYRIRWNECINDWSAFEYSLESRSFFDEGSDASPDSEFIHRLQESIDKVKKEVEFIRLKFYELKKNFSIPDILLSMDSNVELWKPMFPWILSLMDAWSLKCDVEEWMKKNDHSNKKRIELIQKLNMNDNALDFWNEVNLKDLNQIDSFEVRMKLLNSSQYPKETKELLNLLLAKNMWLKRTFKDYKDAKKVESEKFIAFFEQRPTCHNILRLMQSHIQSPSDLQTMEERLQRPLYRSHIAINQVYKEFNDRNSLLKDVLNLFQNISSRNDFECISLVFNGEIHATVPEFWNQIFVEDGEFLVYDNESSFYTLRDDKELKEEMHALGRLMFHCASREYVCRLRFSPLIYYSLLGRELDKDEILAYFLRLGNPIASMVKDKANKGHTLQRWFDEQIATFEQKLYGHLHRRTNLQYLREGFIQFMNEVDSSELNNLSPNQCNLYCCGPDTISSAAILNLMSKSLEEVTRNENESRIRTKQWFVNWINEQSSDNLRLFLHFVTGLTSLPLDITSFSISVFFRMDRRIFRGRFSIFLGLCCTTEDEFKKRMNASIF